MPEIIPFIPESITVHLGPPGSNAENVTVSYLTYLKNVVSSEIYPTWELSALRANILAINSFALNRVYTEFYRCRGYEFDITSSTAFDQAYHHGRSTFENLDLLVDDLFDTYIRRIGFVEPLAAQFCNGTTTTCEGLSQWGSQDLALSGFNSLEILQYYYGDNIELVPNTRVMTIHPSYPGTPLRLGDSGQNVLMVQTELNRIGQNYPQIPKIPVTDGIFGTTTELAVRAFQNIFNLAVDGIVGKATWYELIRVYVSILGLAELDSLGQTYYGTSWQYPNSYKMGDSGVKIQVLQYMLSTLSKFIPQIPATAINGMFGSETKCAVMAFQRYANLPMTGLVNAATWDRMYDAFDAINQVVFHDPVLFPPQMSDINESSLTQPAADICQMQRQIRAIFKYLKIPAPPLSGRYDNATRHALMRIQCLNSLPQTGRADSATKDSLCNMNQKILDSHSTRFLQYPGYDLSFEMKDPNMGGIGA